MLIYLIVTRSCNLECLHCYASSRPKSGGVLSEEAVLAFIEMLKKTETFRQKDGRFVFIFHGGEPLLFGEEKIIGICKLIKENFPSGKVEFQLQTNLTKVGERTVEMVKKYFNNSIGTSFDPGIRRLNGSYSKFKVLWEKNLEYIIQQGIRVTVNVTLAGETGRCMRRFCGVVEYLRKWGVNCIHVERFLLQGRGLLHKETLYVSDDEYFAFMSQLLDWYVDYLVRWERRGGRREDVLFINPLDQMLYLARFGRGASCFAGDCMGNTLALDCNGDVYSCPAFVFSTKGNFSFGNVFKNSYEEIFFNPLRLRLIAEQTVSGCDGCEYTSLCHRGCPYQPLAVRDKSVCRGFFEKLVTYSERYGHVIKNLSEGVV